MNALRFFTPLSLAAALLVGCSEKTEQEAKEALEATKEAASAAAEDTKANVKKAGEVIDAGVDSAREKAQELDSRSPAGDSPDDADKTPEAEER
jgi:hypothetical protein